LSVTLFPHVAISPICKTQRLELGERLDGLAGAGKDAEDVETDRLGEGSALADDNLVSGLDTESGRDVCGEVLVALLVTGVLGDEVEVFAADDQSTCRGLTSAKLSPMVLENVSLIPDSVVGITYGASWWRRRFR
jgi:hypothetical protein